MAKRIIIIGGLSAGPSAAAKARRTSEDVEILMFEKTQYISYATCGIPYSLSGKIKQRDKLMVVKADLLRQRFGVDVHLEEPVTDINPTTKKVITPKGEYTYDKLIFATGAAPFVPPIPGLDQASNWSNCRTIEDFDRLKADGVMDSRKKIAVLGAGLIGIEVSENLTEIGVEVNLIELAPQVLPPWDAKFGHLAENILKNHGIKVHTGATIEKLEVQNGEISSLTLSTGETIEADYIIMGIGGRPNTEMLTSKGANALPNGALIVNEKMETSLPDIYAAGDCASIPNLITGKADYMPMGTHSNKGGRTAGANAAGGDEQFAGGYRTAIVKVFDHTLARTGLNPRALKMENRTYESTFFIANATPGFYPNPTSIFLEIYYDPDTKVLLGAEAFGQHGVDKRIDVLSTAIYAKLKVQDLANLDLAYAPPYSPAKDPVILAGYISANKFKESYHDINSADLFNKIRTTEEGSLQIVDVRTPLEVEKSSLIGNAVNIELDELRDGLDGHFNKNKPIYVYCAKGLRGYVASMILLNLGYTQIYNLAGGYTAWETLGYVEEEEKVMG